MIQLLIKLFGVRVVGLNENVLVELKTPRLRLRSFRVFDDWPRYREYYRDPEVARHLLPWVGSDTQLRAALKARAALSSVSPGYLDLAIQHADDSRLLGHISLATDQHRHERGVMGFVLHRDAWGRGIATEAARGLIDHAFRVIKYQEVWAGCTRGNDRSRRVLEKAGLALTDEKVEFRGAPPGVDVLAFRADGATWLKRQASV